MLKELSIRNFAIIDDLHITLSNGLTILSGETGTGKSIILNAVNLLLGSRASADLVRTGANAAELEALFEIAPRSISAEIMSEHGYDAAEGLLIRRIIARSDSNRIYINGRLATIQVLNEITENLASISGQHAHQGLLKADHHLLILDQFGGLMPLREKVSKSYHDVLPLIQKLNDLKNIQSRQSGEMELLEYQKKEITQAAITADEDKNLEQERTRLKNAEALYEAIHASIETLYSAPGSIIERLVEVRKNLDRAGKFDSQLKSKADRIAETSFQIEDLVAELRSYMKTIQMDDQQLEAVEARLDVLNKLKRKYGGSLDAVLTKLDSINEALSGIENISEKIEDVESKLFDLQAHLAKQAMKLSTKRRGAAKNLERKVVDELSTLKMPQTEFQVSLRNMPADKNTDPHLIANKNIITESGIDRATFLIAPNVGEDLKPLASIASGGELSRVVLAMKAILAETESVETVVFDEVDAGIGGSVAEVVGRKLHELARHHQVICITHLPQIAKFGDHHFSIAKHVADGRTRTTIKPLSTEDRFKELARMLGGEKITPTTLEHAREMLER